MVEKSQTKSSVSCTMKLIHEIQVSVSINKALLEHSHTQSLFVVYCCFHVNDGRVEFVVTETIQPIKLKILIT